MELDLSSCLSDTMPFACPNGVRFQVGNFLDMTTLTISSYNHSDDTKSMFRRACAGMYSSRLISNFTYFVFVVGILLILTSRQTNHRNPICNLCDDNQSVGNVCRYFKIALCKRLVPPVSVNIIYVYKFTLDSGPGMPCGKYKIHSSSSWTFTHMCMGINMGY